MAVQGWVEAYYVLHFACWGRKVDFSVAAALGGFAEAALEGHDVPD